MGCIGCHQLGNLATRTIPKSLGTFKTSEEAWLRRVQSGQAGVSMINIVQGALAGIPIHYLADWTDRIAAGELPAVPPARPSGIERNVVATVRDWSDGKAYLHDLSGTDRRNPTVNAYGLLYGSPELSTDNFPVLDPTHNIATTFKAQRARPGYTDDSRRPCSGAFALLGRGANLGQPGDCAQSDARSIRPRVVHGADSRREESRVLQKGFDTAVRSRFSHRHERAADGAVRAEER